MASIALPVGKMLLQRPMISLADCSAFCGLTATGVLAVAEHAPVPESAARALAQSLLQKPHGPERICDLVVADVVTAQACGDQQHAQTVLHVRHHDLRSHPEARPQSTRAESA